MEQIIRFAYLRSAKITTDNVQDLLAAADRFHVFGLQRECTNFLFDRIDHENCIGLWKFLEFYNCMNTAEKTWKYILVNFRKVAKTSIEFLQLDVNDLVKIISSNNLSVTNESDVFKAIQRWVGFDFRRRKLHYPELLKNLRFAYMCPDFFHNTFLKSEIKRLNSCEKLISSARKIVSEEVPDEILVPNNPRVPIEVIFTVGGWSSKGVVNTIETYDKNVDEWFEDVTAMDSARAYHGTVPFSGYIYIIGGFDGHRYLSSVMTFNPKYKRWEERAPMYMSRCYVSAVALSGMHHQV